jgi:hypothetical protein
VAHANEPAADCADRAAGSADLTPDATLLGSGANEPGADPNGLAIGATRLVAGAAGR